MGDFILLILLIGGYLLPFWIALYRNHMYKWVILALTIGGGWTGLLWVGSLVWAVWPDHKTLVDPLMGNIMGRGKSDPIEKKGEDFHG